MAEPWAGGSMGWSTNHAPKGCSSLPGRGTYLGCRVLYRGNRGCFSHTSVSLSLSLSPPPSSLLPLITISSGKDENC